MNFNLLLCQQHLFKLCYLQAVGNTRYLQKGAVATVTCSQLLITVICQMVVYLKLRLRGNLSSIVDSR